MNKQDIHNEALIQPTGKYEGKVALITNISQVRNVLQKRFLIDGFLVIITTSGRAEILIDNKNYTLEKGDVFSCLPRNILEHLTATEDYEASIIYMAPTFAEEIARRVRLDWTFSMILTKYEKIHVDDTTLNVLLQYFKLLKEKLTSPDTSFKEHIITTLFVATSYELCDARVRFGQQHTPVQSSAAENLMQRFMKLLYASDHRMHSVQEYANALCVSPKYFSSICKQVTGKNARDLINEDMVRYTQLLIADNSLSIKQISDTCGFKNQSHFGTFFRRYAGMSPQHYRDSLRRRE